MFDAMEVVLLCAILDGETGMACDPQTLISQANCLLCTVPPGMWEAIKVSLLCQIAAAGGGGGGGSSIECTVGIPATTPASACALAIDTSDGTIYEWYGGAWH